MARIRTLKPEIWMSPQVMNLTHGARLLFVGLITQADDEGRGIADPRKLKAAIFGGDDDVTTPKVLQFESEIESQGLADFYEARGHGRVYALRSWKSHQYVEKGKASVYPSPPKGNGGGNSPPVPLALPSDSPPVPHGSEGSDLKDLKGSDLTRATLTPVDNGDNSARGARGSGRLKKHSDPEEIERRRREAAAIAAGLAVAKAVKA